MKLTLIPIHEPYAADTLAHVRDLSEHKLPVGVWRDPRAHVLLDAQGRPRNRLADVENELAVPPWQRPRWRVVRNRNLVTQTL